MFSIKVKMVNVLKIRVSIECETIYDMTGYTETIDCKFEDKDRTMAKLQANAYKYYTELEEEFKTVVSGKKFRIENDLETKLQHIYIDFPQSINKYFKDKDYDFIALRHDILPLEKKVTLGDIEHMLTVKLKKVSDMIDVLN